MEEQKCRYHEHNSDVRKLTCFSAALFLITLVMNSCVVIAGIFKAGMAFGIFIVIATIVMIIILFLRLRDKKNN